MHARPITRADLWDVSRLGIEAGSNDDLFVWRYPYASQYPLSVKNDSLHRARTCYAQSNYVGFVAVADSTDACPGIAPGDLIGFAWWRRHNDPSYRGPRSGLFWQLESRLLQLEALYTTHVRPNLAADRAACDEFTRAASLCKSRLPLDEPKPGTPHWHLAAMFVAPVAHGRGVGGELLQWGLAAAREEQDPARQVVSLWGTPHGRWLYEKWGARQVGTMESGSIALRMPKCRIHSALLWDRNGYWTTERKGRGPEVPDEEKAMGYKDYVLFKPELMPKEAEVEKQAADVVTSEVMAVEPGAEAVA